jgi:hypothetical protein
LPNKLPSQTVIREKLCKALSYEKGALKMFVKWGTLYILIADFFAT